MLELNPNSISVGPNRQRRSFDEEALQELQDSIARDGLHQPVVVRREGDQYFLVAGERRLKAVKALGLTTIVCVDKGELTPLQRWRVELEENIIREDLTFWDRSAALAQLHKLRVAEEAEKGEVQTRADTAKEVFGYAGAGAEKVKNAILLQDFKDDPDVSKAKNESEAMSVVRKKLAAEFTAELAKRVKTEASPHTLLEGDCRELMAKMPAGLFDCIVTDPPYGIDAHKMAPLSGSNAGTTHEYEDSFEYAEAVWISILQDGFRICKPDAALYMFCDYRWYSHIAALATHFGWSVWPRPIIWHKPAGGMLGDSTHGPRMSYETILFAYKGDKRTTGLFLDVIVDSSVSSFQHAAAKPPTVYANLLKRSCVPGMAVLDPCCGSGPLFPAANSLLLRATGIEGVAKHVATAKTRLMENIT